jgi:integrase
MLASRPGNKGRRYQADPPHVEEIVAVMRQAGDNPFGRRLRGLIVLLWRAGLRISEALALTEGDLEVGRGSVVVRRGKGGRRREVGMDHWAWEQLRPWLETRVSLPVGPLFCVISGPTRGRPWSSSQARTTSRNRIKGWRPPSVCSAPAPSRACGRDGEGGASDQRHSASARPREPRRHLDLPAGH